MMKKFLLFLLFTGIAISIFGQEAKDSVTFGFTLTKPNDPVPLQQYFEKFQDVMENGKAVNFMAVITLKNSKKIHQIKLSNFLYRWMVIYRVVEDLEISGDAALLIQSMNAKVFLHRFFGRRSNLSVLRKIKQITYFLNQDDALTLKILFHINHSNNNRFRNKSKILKRLFLDFKWLIKKKAEIHIDYPLKQIKER